MIYHSVLPEDEGLLGKVRITGPIGVQRPTFHRRLVDLAQEHGVEIVWGHQLVALEQHEESVTVTFQNGKTDTASFVVGCDGIHSNTRACLFGKEAADFTGLIQVSSGFALSSTSESRFWATDRRVIAKAIRLSF